MYRLILCLCLSSAVSLYHTYNGSRHIYMEKYGTHIKYNVVNERNGLFLLTRLHKLDIDLNPIMIETLLNSKYEQITDWEYVPEFEFTRDHLNFFTEIKKPHFYDRISAIHVKNIRVPYSEFITPNSNVLRDLNVKCFLKHIDSAIGLGYKKCDIGTCYNKSVIAFQGTHFNEIDDLYDNVIGPFDDYKKAFENIDNFVSAKYDYCIGYSLGAGIVKYMSNLNYCANIITFAPLLTRDYNSRIPIVEYINTQFDPEGCCRYTWDGKCIEHGFFIVDPVSLIFDGEHHNVKFIMNTNQPMVCTSSLSYSIWKTGFKLHILSDYIDKLT